MKKASLILFLLLSMTLYAQNNIVYVRYDMAQGNASLVVSKIDEIISKNKGEFVVYFSNGQTPEICDNVDDWSQLKTKILSQQTSPDYYMEEDLARLNSIFEEKFKETVSIKKSISIKGANDGEWRCSFILSKRMLDDNGESDFVIRMISINELVNRMPVKIWSYDDDKIVSVIIDELNKNKLFNYFTDK